MTHYHYHIISFLSSCITLYYIWTGFVSRNTFQHLCEHCPLVVVKLLIYFSECYGTIREFLIVWDSSSFFLTIFNQDSFSFLTSNTILMYSRAICALHFDISLKLLDFFCTGHLKKNIASARQNYLFDLWTCGSEPYSPNQLGLVNERIRRRLIRSEAKLNWAHRLHHNYAGEGNQWSIVLQTNI